MSMLNEARKGELCDNRDRSFKGRVKELIPQKGDPISEIVRKLIYICAVCVLIYSLVDAYHYKFGTSDLHEDKDLLSGLYNSSDDNTQLQPDDNTQVTVDTPNDDSTQNDNQFVVNGETYEKTESQFPAGMLSNFEKLYTLNSDVIGWLSIDGLSDSNGANYIDYPVMQTTDNSYYLEHDFFKAEKNYGALFADYRGKITADSSPDNTIIYGHNMGAGTFFSHLHDYKKRASFVKEHNLITYSTLWEENDYVIIGCFLTGIKDDQDNIPIFKYHNYINFKTIEDFDYWYKNILYRNYYITDIECTMDDQYITLSTCSTEIYDSRFVVVARKLRDGEDASKYTYISNPNARKPAAFYEAYGMEVPKDNGPEYEYYIPSDEELACYGK